MHSYGPWEGAVVMAVETSPTTLIDVLFERSPDGLCLVAPDSTIVRANVAWLRSTGFREEQVVGRSIIDLFPAGRDVALAMHARARAGHRVDVQRHAQVVGGRETWWEGSIDPVAMEGGTGLLITAREVSPDPIAPADPDDALRATTAERKYKELFESMIEAYCVIEMIFDDDGTPVDFRYVETNAAFVRHATRPMLGKRVKEIIPDVEQFWLNQYGRVAVTGEPAQLEHVVAGLGDQWFRTSAFRVGGEESRTVAVLFENITEHKRAEETQRRVTEQYQQQVRLFDGVTSTTPDFVYVFDLQGRFLYANRRLLEVWGMQLPDVIGKTCRELGYERS